MAFGDPKIGHGFFTYSKTDPNRGSTKKAAGQPAQLSYLGHTRWRIGTGWVVAAMATQADLLEAKKVAAVAT